MLSGQLKCSLQSPLFSVYCSKLLLYSYKWEKFNIHSIYFHFSHTEWQNWRATCYFTRLWTFKQASCCVSSHRTKWPTHASFCNFSRLLQVVLIPATNWQKLN